MPTISDFNYIVIKIPDKDNWAVGDTPLDGLALHTDCYKMDESTGTGVFCPHPIIKRSYKFNENSSGGSCNQEGSRNGKRTLQ